jgi:hypothetical protein
MKKYQMIETFTFKKIRKKIHYTFRLRKLINEIAF